MPVRSGIVPESTRPSSEVLKYGDVRMVRWHGGIEARSKLLDRSAFNEWLDAGERQFILSLSDVERIDSFAIGELVACSKRARMRNATIKLILSKPQIDLFTLLKLDLVFQFYEREDEALGDFATGSK